MYVVACTLWRRCDASARKTQELPRLRTAIFAEEYNCKRNPVRHGLMRVMLFTMVILQHALIARASLLTDFCPTMDAIRLPDEKEQWDADGFPQFITLELTNWKGNTKRRKQVRARGGAAPRCSTRRAAAVARCGVARRVARRTAPWALRACCSTGACSSSARRCVSDSRNCSFRLFTSSATPSTRSSAPWLR